MRDGSVSDASSGAPVGQPASSAGNPQPAANDGIPSGVVAGTAYDAGQQLRVLNPLLNIRQQPDVNSPLAGGLQRGDYVVVLAGPVEDDIYTWWRVQAANGQQGWVAGIIDGTATIGAP